MEIVKQEVENDSDNEEIYFGPITKREIVSKLKYYNLCKYELLQPLEVYQDTDILNDNHVKFYEDLFPTGSSSQDESAETQSLVEHFPDSLNLSHKNSFTESQLLKSEYSEKNSELGVKSLKNIDDESALLNSTCFSNSTTHNSTVDTNERENISLDSTYENSGCKLYNSTENFNCTLEEMEMLMKFGENYINESRDTKPVETVLDKSEKENDVPSIVNSFNKIDIRSPLQIKEYNILKPNTLSINSKETKSKSPPQSKENILTPKNKPVMKPNSQTKLTNLKSPSPFKIPSRIGKASPGFKNIQSPIAMYIKNSARAPLMQNVVKATIETGTYKTIGNNDMGENEGAEDIQEAGLPARSYKRAPRAVLLSDEPEPSLPPSIRRLIQGRVTPQVIKHVARTHTNSGSAVDNDLTLMSSSQAQSQPDVSFYISKNAARTNRLQRHL